MQCPELMIFTECVREKEKNMQLQGRVESFIKIDDTEILWCKLMIHFNVIDLKCLQDLSNQSIYQQVEIWVWNLTSS